MRRVALFLLLLVAAAGCTSRDRAAAQRPQADRHPGFLRRLAMGLPLEGRRSEHAAPHRARRARRKPHSELSSEDVSESLHDRHGSLSRPPRHRRELDLRCGDRPHVHERQASKEVRDPMWWGGEPIWVTVERCGAARPRRCSGLAPKRRSAGCCRTTGRRTTTNYPGAGARRSGPAVARPAGGRASDVHRPLLLGRR